ncbi:acyl-CoA dehydrogenase family protein [Cupriavidus sp. L7L]|uniref:acyl-CoA dehydrogenase family protein n=1 Tax=Cupriavidus sp. L7L TaxID=2546443 RepID=UPI00105575E1|nr:acyl-CoA dehydrogenase family protein [Cupriavidus sp. L7L]TDF64535.1 pimeloyl-CoA dehydrogenase small subunit [Cupriavidus sp. L7L]
MNFQHTEDRRMLADALNRYITQAYSFETRRNIEASHEGYSEAKWNQLSELGVLGALFTETEGGFGGSGFDIAVVFESLGRGLVVEPVLGSALLAGSAVLAAGRSGHESLAQGLISGSRIAALAHAEPDSGYSLTHVSTLARRDGDGWMLSGSKANITQGQSASTFVVSARTAGEFADVDGLSLFVVPAGAAGLSLHEHAAVDGGRVIDLKLDDVRLPATALLGEEGRASDVIECALGKGVLALCAQAVGAMDVALASTLEYLKTRKQFGVPVGSFQALQHRMATMVIEVEQARSALINASAAVDGTDRLAREKALSAAKYLIGKVGTMVAEECVQMHGGIGMTSELPLSHYAKRLLMIDHELGDAAFHLERYTRLKED